MDIATVNKLLLARKLPKAMSVKKIDVGFSNEVYSLDDTYILKICGDKQFQQEFENEPYLYQYFQDKLPVPRLLAYDGSKTFYLKQYMVYSKIEGENLYNVWHQLDTATRKQLVKQLCGFLKLINGAEVSELPNQIKLKPVSSWKQFIADELEHYVATAAKMKLLPPAEIQRAREFIEQTNSVLNEQKLALTYWDPHFDNVLVQGGRISGLLDMERTWLASIDFVLDTIWRMVDTPKLYMSEYAEQFAKAEDYQDLRNWYKEFYPELFAFKDINSRVALYSLLHDLRNLPLWPKSQRLIQSIKTTISQSAFAG